MSLTHGVMSSLKVAIFSRRDMLVLTSPLKTINLE